MPKRWQVNNRLDINTDQLNNNILIETKDNTKAVVVSAWSIKHEPTL